MVVIDATILLLMLRPGTPVPAGPSGTQIDKPKERIDFLVKELEKQRTKIIIPTPALAEALVQAGPSGTQQIIEHLQKYAVFRIEPFDTRAAVEVAAMTRMAAASGKGKRGDSAAIWAKVKYDRQIVAIAKVCGATTIYSDDGDIRNLAKAAKIEVIGLADLPLPPADAQLTLQLSVPASEPLIPPTETADDDQARA
jgi:hypothetical protein